MTSYHQELTNELNSRQDQTVGHDWYVNEPWSDGYDCPKGIRCDFGVLPDHTDPTSVKLLTNLYGFRVVSIVNGDDDVVYEGECREQAMQTALEYQRSILDYYCHA